MPQLVQRYAQLSGARLALAIVPAIAWTGCLDDDQGPVPHVQGSLNLERSDGADRYLVRAGSGAATITGKADPAWASIALSDTAGRRTARVNLAPDGTFRAALADLPQRGTVTFRLAATSLNARPWKTEIVASRQPTGAAARSARADVRVPARDDSPPTAIMVLRSDGRVVSSISPVRDDEDAPVRLRQPSLVLTARVRDRDGGTGRVRASLTYERICLDRATGLRTIRRRVLHFPPSEIARVKLPPGATAPGERLRRARVRLDPGPDCVVRGKTWADATNASGLESFSDQIRFRFGGP